jgi:zinc protease
MATPRTLPDLASMAMHHHHTVDSSMANSRSVRLRALGAIGSVLVLASLAAAPHAEGSQQRSHGVPRIATDDSLPRDSALSVGILPNGLRYYIRVNKTPAKRAFLWLAVNAGSVLEDDDQQGFAHFLEHMAFNGTTHFPRHELISTLQLAGIRFGADINAHTGFDETVYQLEVPTDNGKSLTEGLTMIHDWANGGMLIDSREVLAERGVVLGEWRSRMLDSVSQRVQDHQDSLLFGESRYLTRAPIGLVKLIEKAEPEPIRRFYKDWYRPDLMAVVAVGDFDKSQVEREIKARFGTIPAATIRRPRVSPRLPSSAEPIVNVYRGPVTPSVLVLWKESPQPVETRATVRLQLVEQLLFEGIQRRFVQLREQASRPFFLANTGRADLTRTANAHFLQVVARADSLEGGLAAALVELERVAQNGVQAPVLERQKAELLKRLEGDAMAAAARPSVQYVQEYVAHYLGGDASLLSSARQRLVLTRELLETITPSDLARAAAFWRGRNDLLVMYNLPEFAHVRLPTRESLLALFDSVAHERFAPDSVRSVADAPLMARLPAPGRIVGEKRDALSGITEWTLSNGARVIFKPTPFNADELLIDARSPGGASLLPDSLFFSSGRLVGEMMTQAAGFGEHGQTSIEQQLVSNGVLREFDVSITNTEEGIRVGGSPRDLTTLFQLLHLQFTAPKLDTAALNIWKRVGSPPGYSVDDQIAQILSKGNPRLAPISEALVQLADTGTAMAVYRDRFGNAGDFTFSIVGAATPQRVRPLVERYLASLPSTGKREVAPDLGVREWNHRLQTVDRILLIPKASTTLLFEGEFPAKPDEYLTARRRLDAVSWVLRLEFTDILREQMAGTYGVGVDATTRPEPQEHFRLMVQFDAAPDRMSGMIDTMFAIIDTVRARGATTDELQKIGAMQRRARETALADNHYWLNTIELYDRLGIPFDRIVIPARGALTVAEVRAAAREFLPMDAYIHLTAMPKDSTLYTHMERALQAPADSASAAPHATPATLRVFAPSTQPRH